MKLTLKELHRLRRTVSLLRIIRRHVKLKKAGTLYKGRCPFHTDSLPSFVVNEDQGLFHCFGCGVGGDIFGWTMRYEKLSFPEAVERLRAMP